MFVVVWCRPIICEQHWCRSPFTVCFCSCGAQPALLILPCLRRNSFLAHSCNCISDGPPIFPCLPSHLPTYLPTCPRTYPPCLPTHQPTLPAYLPTYPPIYLPAHPPTLPAYLPTNLPSMPTLPAYPPIYPPYPRTYPPCLPTHLPTHVPTYPHIHIHVPSHVSLVQIVGATPPLAILFRFSGPERTQDADCHAFFSLCHRGRIRHRLRFARLDRALEWIRCLLVVLEYIRFLLE